MGKSDSSRGNAALAAHYEDRFVEYVKACARLRFARDPDPFLLQARRALEAAIYAVWSSKIGAPPARPLTDLLKELAGKHGLIGQARVHDFEALRARTNRAAHVPGPDEKDVDVGRVAQQLGDVAAWVGDHGLCLRGELGPVVREALARIDGEDRLVPPDLELEQLREEGSRLRASEARARAEAEELRARLGGASSDDSPRRERSVNYTTGALVAVVALAVGTGAGWGLSRSMVGAITPASPRGLTRETRPSAAPPVAPAPAADAASIAAPEDAGADATQEPDCPDGTIRVDGGDVRLRPPHDREWAPRASATATHDIGSFCVQRELVTTRAFEECVEGGACEREPRCRASAPAGSPARCVSRDDASAYCGWRFGAGARLPSAVELEHVARGSGVELPRARANEPPWEWTHDPCGPAAFTGRGQRTSTKALATSGMLDSPAAEPHPRLSWHCPTPIGTTLHHFRCVVPLRPE